LQNEIEDLRHQIQTLSGEGKRVTVLLAELSDVVPTDAYLSAVNLRAGRLTVDGMARSASDLIAALEKSKHLRNVSFTAPQTSCARSSARRRSACCPGRARPSARPPSRSARTRSPRRRASRCRAPR